MSAQKIHSKMRVGEVLKRYPLAAEVFRKRGYPDLTSGLLSLTLNRISVKIPVDDLLLELNTAVAPGAADE